MEVKMKILLVEDDKTISFAINRYFENRGNEVISCYTLDETMGLSLAKFDVIILDINLPDGIGYDYLKYIREIGDIPVLLLTVRDEEKDVLSGFKYGADDYLTKPFSLPVLDARIKNIIKRSNAYKGEEIEYKSLKLYPRNKTAYLHSEYLELGILEYNLLELFLQNAGLTLTREYIIDTLWNSDHQEISDNTLSVTIKRLREKLGAYKKYISTVRGIGYYWGIEDE